MDQWIDESKDRWIDGSMGRGLVGLQGFEGYWNATVVMTRSPVQSQYPSLSPSRAPSFSQLINIDWSLIVAQSNVSGAPSEAPTAIPTLPPTPMPSEVSND